jgi:hypothetical protein
MSSNGASSDRPSAPAPTRRVPRRRSHVSMVVAGAVVMAGGLAVAVVEQRHFPKGSVWVVVGITFALVALIRAISRRRR